MKDATPRMKALLAGGAAVLVFGIIVPANATADGEQGRHGTGVVGQAHDKANPKNQGPNDGNSGFTCDSNRGAGQGNPALDPGCGSGTWTPPGNPGGGSGGNGGGNPGGGSGDPADYSEGGT